MASDERCQRCGTPLEPGGEGAVCLGCLVLAALGDEEGGKAEPVAEEELLEGSEVDGRFRIVRRLGEGGNAVVYLAEQTHPVPRLVACKFLKAGHDSAEIVARFEAEREVLARMDHPSIATVFDAGTSRTGRPFFVLEYVDGVPITEFASTHQLDIDARLRLFEKVCAAVQHAHSKGIIHRDLKPSNILVATSDGDDEPLPKVIDFGIARAIGHETSERTLFVTRQGALIGTPAYMSPEQLGGHPDALDTRSDVYSLGVVLYQLLAGALPHDPSELAKLGFGEIQRVVCEEDPAKPSTRAGDGDGRGLVGDLDWIALKALAKEPDRRYESAAELAADLRRHRSHDPVIAGPPTLRYRLTKLARKHRAAAVFTAAFLTLLVAATIISITLAIRATRAEREATHQADNRLAMSNFLQLDLLRSLDPNDQPDREITMLEALRRAERKVGAAFADKPLLEAEMRYTIGFTFYQLGHSDLALPQAARAHELSRQERGADHEQTIRYRLFHANLHRSLGDIDSAKRVLGDLAEKVLAKPEPESELELRIIGIHAGILSTDEQLDEAAAVMERALAFPIAQQYPKYRIDMASNYADVLERSGRAEEGLPVMAEMLELTREEKGEMSLETLQARGMHANLLAGVGRIEEAEVEARDVLDKMRQVAAPDSRYIHLAAQKLADYLDILERDDEAIEILRDVVALPAGEDGTLNYFQANAMNNLAATIAAAGDNDEALALYEQLVADRIKAVGPDAIRTLRYRHSHALMLYDMRRHAEALEVERDVLERQMRVAGVDHPYTLRYVKVCAVLASMVEGPEAGLKVLREVRDALGGKFDNAKGVGAEQVPQLIDYWNTWAQPDEQIVGDPLDAITWARMIEGFAADPKSLALARYAVEAAAFPSPIKDLRLSRETLATLLGDIPHPVPAEAEWRYQNPADHASANWFESNFDDTSWRIGRAEFGYGDGDETTVLDFGEDPASKPLAVRFRKRFTLPDPLPEVGNALLFVNADDGALVYLNGSELARIHVPPGELGAGSVATYSLGGDLENRFVPVRISIERLRSGENVLSVEVRQFESTSSDLSFSAILAFPCAFDQIDEKALNGLADNSITDLLRHLVETGTWPEPTAPAPR